MPASSSASRRPTIPATRSPASASSAYGRSARSWPAAAITARRRSVSAISWRCSRRPALGDVIPSYQPGVMMADLAACLPDFAVAAIREAIPAFDRQIKGFAMADAVMTGVETRTSSPIRIGRDADPPEPQHPRTLSGGRGRRLCRRHPLCRRRRHPRRRGGGAEHDRSGAPRNGGRRSGGKCRGRQFRGRQLRGG